MPQALWEAHWLGPHGFLVHIEVESPDHHRWHTALPHPHALFSTKLRQWVYLAVAYRDRSELSMLQTIIQEEVNDLEGYVTDLVDGPYPFGPLLRHSPIATAIPKSQDTDSQQGNSLVDSNQQKVQQDVQREDEKSHLVEDLSESPNVPAKAEIPCILAPSPENQGIPCSLPLDLWDKFCTYRYETPGPGMSPEAEVARATALLTRIIGNAMTGSLRAVPIHSKAFSSQLRWDPTSEAIFSWFNWKVAPLDDGRLALHPPFPDQPSGPTLEGEPSMDLESVPSTEEARPAPLQEDHSESSLAPSTFDANTPSSHRSHQGSAPNMADDLLQRRAYLELVAFCVAMHAEIPMPEDPNTKLHVKHVDPLALLGEKSPKEPHQAPSAEVANAYALLGVASDATPDEITHMYRINSAAFPEHWQALFLALDSISKLHPEAESLRMLFALEHSKGLYTLEDLVQSYRDLHLDPPPEINRSRSFDADLILQAYQRRIDDLVQHGNDQNLKSVIRAMQILAQYYTSAALQARLDQGVITDVNQAYQLIQSSKDIDDSLVVMAFEVYMAETQSRQELLRTALQAIAKDRNSNYLHRYLAGDTRSPEQAIKPQSEPRGLQNIGNTCYLNSVLQYFFHLTLIRTMVLQMKNVINIDACREHPPLPMIAGRQVSLEELQRSCRCMYDQLTMTVVEKLASLFDEMQSTTQSSVTPEKELAYLALVPLAWEQAYIASNTSHDTLLQQIGTQQDVSECLDNMIFQIEAALAAYPDQSWAAMQKQYIHTMFFGQTTQALCNQQDVTTKQETFQTLPVTLLPESKTIYDALDTFFDDQILYKDDGQSVRRVVSLREAPPLLQIQVQRVQYDRTLHRAVKTQAEIALDEFVYLDRYMECSQDADPFQIQRHELTQEDQQRITSLRTRIAQLLGEDQSLPSQLEDLHEALAVLAQDSWPSTENLHKLKDASQSLRSQAQQLRVELQQVRSTLHSRWVEHQKYAYRLAAVFMHRGEATHGHYFLDLYDVSQDHWTILNDTRTDTISLQEVQKDPTGATSYLVVYVRENPPTEPALLSNPRRAF
ncbi:ubiquitinyl hydrolase 1 [Malassezia psittaci]|uniref:ubiquitinyl hydrolase 1 n=1 Tax=Malassezia psittaci TaxID=1821823 RepID=A0AAF0JGF6_9BASI|nr:ubiquitinyl hydrolase 1 [Malassezia psittaci]